MNLASFRTTAGVFLSTCMLLSASLGFSQVLPDTEKGNVILRAFDRYNFGPLFPTYIGHVGILGEWQGTDAKSAHDYDVYDMQQTSITVSSTGTLTFYNTMVQKRSFWWFARANDLLMQPYLSYDGGYVKRNAGFPAPPGEAMTPQARDDVVRGAASWQGIYLTTKFIPFTKWPATSTFRCDGIAEYILEQAGVGGGQGFWRLYLEGQILTPSVYPLWMVAEREHGKPPSMIVTSTGGVLVGNRSSISSTTIYVTAVEEPTGSGLSKMVLGGPTPSTKTYNGELSVNETFPGLSDGMYQLAVYDKEGNHVEPLLFSVRTQGPASGGRIGPPGKPVPPQSPSTHTTGGRWEDPSCLATIQEGVLGSTFSCSANCTSTAAIAQMQNFSPGTYTSTATNCAGMTSTSTFTVTAGTMTLELCYGGSCSGVGATGAVSKTRLTITGQAGGGSPGLNFCDAVVLEPRTYCHDTPGVYEAFYEAPCAQSFEFSVHNSTNTQWLLLGRAEAAGSGNSTGMDISFSTAGATIKGSVTIPGSLDVCPSTSSATPGIAVWAKYWDLFNEAVQMAGAYAAAAVRAVKGAFPNSSFSTSGSEVALGDSATVRYSLDWPTGYAISTTTLAIYQWDGADWSSATVTDQYIFKDPTTSVLTATGTITHTGIYAILYAGSDSSAPVTSLSFQGSTRSFLTDVFVATDAYVVLASTDPTVNGFASTVATTYYRIDPTTASPAFSVYSSSVPLPLGFHVFEYRSVDWAGNYEPIKTSTFLVTAGTLFRASSRLSSRGSDLMGFLDYGVLFDVQSRAENSLTLQISSANASPLLSADNIGDIGLGLSLMSARFDVQGGTPTLAALALRSGNSIASTSSVQIAFGYNGEASMRHAITTTHSTATVGNRMDFYVWNPLAPSTSSIASMDVLALQVSTTSSGGVFHVRPVGNPIGGVELIVSDGVTPGGGTVLRADAQTHSSRALKSDIRPLTQQERAAAARDALTLKHSRFNYKSEPPGTPPHTGVMHEDAPASIRGPGGSVSLDARLLNLEVALQEAAQRLKRLRERMRRLETR